MSVREKIADYMFVGCFASPVVLFSLIPEEGVYLSGSHSAWVLLPLLIIPSFIGAMLLDHINNKNIFHLIHAIVTFCVGIFAALFSLWYLLISVYAIVFIFLKIEFKKTI